MKIYTVVFALLCFSFLGNAQTNCLTQNFNSSNVVATYYGAETASGSGIGTGVGAPPATSTTLFNSIFTGSSIVSGALQFSRVSGIAPATGLVRSQPDLANTTDFMQVKFDITASVTGATTNTNSTAPAIRFQMGNGYTTDNTVGASATTFGQLSISPQTTGGFKVGYSTTNNTLGALSATAYTGTQTITWVLNNSTVNKNYTGPNGSLITTNAGKIDIWVGNTRLYANIASVNASQVLTDIKMFIGSTTATNGTVTTTIDNISITPAVVVGPPQIITGFAGETGGKGVNLYWKTTGETNSSRFDIKRSTDNVNFDIVGTVNAAGNSSVEKRYFYIDLSPAAGTYYYKVEQVNTDSSTKNSSVISVNYAPLSFESSQNYNLNVVYFAPTDNLPIVGYEKRLSEILLWGQDYYKTEMARNGFGSKTFSLLKDVAAGRVKITLVKGNLTKNNYQYTTSGAIKNEVDAYFAANPAEKTSEHTLIILPNDPDGRIPFFGSGRSCYAKDYDGFDIVNLGSLVPTPQANGENFTAWLGGMMHELGHGLNLPHNCAKVSEVTTLGTALMASGNTTLGASPTFLTMADCTILNNNQVFNSNSNTYYGPASASIPKILSSFDVTKNAIIVSGKMNVTGSPVTDILFYNDSNYRHADGTYDGFGVNKDYDSVTWASPKIGADGFYIEMPISEFKYKETTQYELRVLMVHENGMVSTASYSYSFVDNIPVLDFGNKKLLTRCGWTVTANSEDPFDTFGATGFANSMLDGDINSVWFPLRSVNGGVNGGIYNFTVDMQKQKALAGVTITNRQNNLNQAAQLVDVEVSTDNVNWIKVVSDYQSPKVTSQVNITFSGGSVACRWFRVTIKSAWGGATTNPSLAEINAYTNLPNVGPEFTVPAMITIYKDATGGFDAATSVTGVPTDVCDDYDVNTVVTFSDALSAGSCSGETIITRTWKVTDTEDGFTEKVQIITVKDNLAPVITANENGTRSTNAGICTYTVVADEFDVTATDNASTTLSKHFVLTGATTGEADSSLNGVVFNKGVTTVACTVSDACGNTATSNFNITVNDTEIPVIISNGDKNVNTDIDSSGATVAVSATATDNCDTVTPTGIRSDAKALTDLFPIGTTSITWNAIDANDNSALAKTQTVIVEDITPPTIACPENITLSACQDTATWSVIATDNSQSVTVEQTAGPASGSTFAPGSTTTISYTATDASGNSTNCSFTVTRQAKLDLTVSNSNSQLYYGYKLDQSTIIKGTPSGGVGPYNVTITMDRPLVCNAETSSGDEIWTTSTATSSSSFNICPSIGSPLSAPISSVVNVVAGSSYSVEATLMTNATFTVTVTDGNGCSVSKTTTVYAEDARCSAGNSNIVKVKLCHKTGNNNDPCHEICVPESAVNTHLAHGDFLGTCTSNCVAPPSPINAKLVKSDKAIQESVEFKVIAYPNPADYQFTLVLEGGSNEKVEVLVYDMLARRVKRIEKSDGQPIVFGGEFVAGEYLAVIRQGANIKTVNLIKK